MGPNFSSHTHGSAAPKPHDPRTATMSPDELNAQFEAALPGTAETLAEQLAEYEAAYAVLAEALQDKA